LSAVTRIATSAKAGWHGLDTTVTIQHVATASQYVKPSVVCPVGGVPAFSL